MVVHLTSIVLTGFFIYLASPGTDLFSWHPTCMMLGFVLFMLQAIVVFSPESSLMPNSPKPDRVQLHWVLNLFGLGSIAFGFAAVYFNKEIHGRKHFTSWHSRFGLVTMAGVLCAALGGILAKYSYKLKDWIKPLNLKLYHATGGMIVYILAMATIALATYSNWFHNRMGKYPWVGRLCLWIPVILAICVARQVTQSFLPRVLTPRESAIDAKAKTLQAKVDAKVKKSS